MECILGGHMLVGRWEQDTEVNRAADAATRKPVPRVPTAELPYDGWPQTQSRAFRVVCNRQHLHFVNYNPMESSTCTIP